MKRLAPLHVVAQSAPQTRYAVYAAGGGQPWSILASRPVLAGRTAREVFQQDRISLPDREAFMEDVDRTDGELHDAATTRAERDAARRRAVEQVLLAYGLMKVIGDVSHNFKAAEGTK